MAGRWSVLLLTTILWIQPSAAQERPSKADLNAFNIWAKATVDEFYLYRQLELDLLSVGTSASQPRFLRTQLYQELRPSQEVLTRVMSKNHEAVERVEECRQALVFLKYALLASLESRSVRDKRFVSEGREYVDQARSCEKGIRAKPLNSRFREVIDSLAEPQNRQ